LPGLSEDAWKALRPSLLPAGEAALDVWAFCGRTWAPDIVPLAAAYTGFDDLELLMHLVLKLRDYLAEREAKMAKARSGKIW